jgi:alpha-glucosidase
MMNYWYRTATLAWLNGEIDAVQVNAAVRDARQGYGLSGLLCSWNLLSSHDTPRVRTAVADATLARLAWLTQCTLPGIPLIYYGEEIGMQGGPDPECRRPMRWNEDEWDHGQRAWLKQLIALRQAHAALQYGDILVLGDRLPGNALVFLRFTDISGEAVLVVVNAATTPLRVRLLLPYSHWYDGTTLHDALGGAGATGVQAGSVLLDVAGQSGAVYLPGNPYNNYDLFKERNRN